MSELNIKNVPSGIHKRLQERAEQNGRTVDDEVISILRQVLFGKKEPSLEDFRRVRVHPRKPITGEMVDEAKKWGRK